MRVGIIGRTADGKEMFDGQTVSTRLWRDELNKCCKDAEVFVVDTYDYKRRIIPIMLKWIQCLCCCSHLVVMLSGNGLTFFLPWLYYANKFLGKRIYHRVIGGELDAYVKQHPKSVKYLNSCEVNWVQSKKMIEKLRAVNVNNGQFMENFRNITPVSEKQLPRTYAEPFLFCTFSRVSKAKGIDLAIRAIQQVNKEAQRTIAKLDIYGPIEESFKEEFQELLKEYADCASYKGSIPSEQAVGVLKDYFCHLFPTTWKGEGFPGTLIDCYNAGLPTIASTWAYNEEFIEEGKTGYLYDWEQPELLKSCIIKAIAEVEKNYEMRKNCLAEAGKYSPSAAMRKVMDSFLDRK